MDRPKTPNPTMIIFGLFLISAAALSFEVTMTRVYSFLFVQSLVYILISSSMAGIGFGAVLTYYLSGARRSRILTLALLLPAAMLILLLLVNSYRTLLIPSLVFTFLIFTSLGIFQVQIFQHSGARISKLYAADLIGASSGALLSYLGMNTIGTLGVLYVSIFLLGFAFLIIYALFFREHRKRIPAAGLFMVLILSAAGFTGLGSEMFPNSQWQKELTVALDDSAREPLITRSRWSAFGRVDLVETKNPYFKTMYIDGGAGTKMIGMPDGKVPESVASTLLLNYMGGVPLLTVEEKDRQRAAVIGSGGGIDVVTLLLADFRQIDAVEINPDFIQIVREHDEYSGGIYNGHPRVTVFNDEGRAFLRAQEKGYNLILMGLPIIKSVRSMSNHALTENYLFTHEAFSEYLKALEPGGYLIVIAHYPNELKRLVSNALRALELDSGLSAAVAMQHIVCLGDDRNPTLVLKKGVFTPTEIAGFSTILSNFPVTGSTNFLPFAGSGVENAPFNPEMVDLSRGRISLRQFADIHKEDISWVSDASPFFYQMRKGVPFELKVVGLLIAGAVIILGLLFVRTYRPLKEPDRNNSRLLLFPAFAAIGIGFMLVEIAILQKFIIFWHYQTLALAIVLAAILVSSGAGSLFSGTLKTHKAFLRTTAIMILMQLTAAMTIGPILSGMEQASFTIKFVLTLVLIFPVFVFMGVPFPYLLSLSRETGDGRNTYPWMMGINSFATLAGGVLSLVIAILVGYQYVLIAGVLCYIVFLLLTANIKTGVYSVLPGTKP